MSRFKRALTLPLHIALARGVVKITRALFDFFQRQKDSWCHTYGAFVPAGGFRRFQGFSDKLILPDEQTQALAKHYMQHRFDLLGSGWTVVKPGMKCRGIEGYRYRAQSLAKVSGKDQWSKKLLNRSNRTRAQRIWQLVDKGYQPIDWQVDFKSGFRWTEKTWYRDIVYTHKPGIDIKVPWELSRMQHLITLALASAKAKRPGFEPAEAYAREFRNQVLDFIATNPPRFGVNWVCTMDVAIRVANWVIAYDLFRCQGIIFDPAFEREFWRSVYRHARHIMDNLEWMPDFRSNHYLADITGLLFATAYLPCTLETNAWLAFCVQELIREVGLQFTPDGANFEASTSYHRLSAEMAVYATALVLGLPKQKRKALIHYDSKQISGRPKLSTALCYYRYQNGEIGVFPEWYAARLEKMAEFSMHITKPDGQIAQIGDNDSGRFFKFLPSFRKLSVLEAKKQYANLDGYADLPDDAVYWDENFLDHRHLVAAIDGIFSRRDFATFYGKYRPEKELTRQLAESRRLPGRARNERNAAQKIRIETGKRLELLRSQMESCPDRRECKFTYSGKDLRKGLRLYCYPDFGLYIFRSEILYLAIHCGPIGQNGNGGHSHNDQLAVELSFGKENIICDPGTYLYTPLPHRRNQFRSTSAHFTPLLLGREQNCWMPGAYGLFFLVGEKTDAKCLYFGEKGFAGRHHGFGAPLSRLVLVESDRVRILDQMPGLKNGYFDRKKNLFSNGYGRLLS